MEYSRVEKVVAMQYDGENFISLEEFVAKVSDEKLEFYTNHSGEVIIATGRINIFGEEGYDIVSKNDWIVIRSHDFNKTAEVMSSKDFEKIYTKV